MQPRIGSSRKTTAAPSRSRRTMGLSSRSLTCTFGRCAEQWDSTKPSFERCSDGGPRAGRPSKTCCAPSNVGDFLGSLTAHVDARSGLSVSLSMADNVRKTSLARPGYPAPSGTPCPDCGRQTSEGKHWVRGSADSVCGVNGCRARPLVECFAEDGERVGLVCLRDHRWRKATP